MKLLSSPSSGLLKWFNASAAVLIALGLVLEAAKGFPEPRPIVYLIGALLFVCAVGSFLFYDWPMADEVFDTGDGLAVRRRAIEQKFALSDIQEIDSWNFGQSRHMTIVLAQASTFGTKIRFRPHPDFIARDAESINRRIREARSPR